MTMAFEKKTHVTLFLILTIAMGKTANAQESVRHRQVDLYAELGYSIPFKESFRANYDRTLFVGSTKAVPLSFGVGGEYYLTNASAVFLELKRFGHQLSTSDKVTLTVMPAIVGYRYYFFEDSYPRISIGAGLGFYLATTSITYSIINVNGVKEREESDSKNYFGVGLNLGVSLEWFLSTVTSLGVATNFDVNKIGSVENGGLGNLGGFYVGLRFGYSVFE